MARPPEPTIFDKGLRPQALGYRIFLAPCRTEPGGLGPRGVWVVIILCIRSQPVRDARYGMGNLTVKVVPTPTSLATPTSPPYRPTICLTMDSPSPVPPSSRLRPLSTR